MRPSIFKKTVTVVVCLAFLMLVVPSAANAGKKASNADSQNLVSKPLLLLYSLFPYLSGLLNLNIPGLPTKDSPKKANNTPTLTARPTGDLPPPPRPSGGD
jgi:hypothetical protein